MTCPCPGPSKATKADYLPVLFGLSGIRVIEPRFYLYVADYPVDKDYDCPVIVRKRRAKYGQEDKTGPEAMPEVQRMGQGHQNQSLPQVRLPIQWKAKGGPAPEPAAAEKKAGDTVTFEQIRAVTQTVKTIGGFARLNELLGLIKEVGGLRK